MNRKHLLFGGLLLALLALGFILFFIFYKKNSDELTLYGNVDVRQVDIGFRVNGKVKTLFFEEGDFVKEGELLAILEKSPYDSEVEKAKAVVYSTEASLDLWQKLLERRLELIGVGGVSEEDLDEAQAKVLELGGELVRTKASLKVAEDRLSYTEVYAPSDGVILTRIREPGSIVLESESVYTLSISSPVWIRAYIDEAHLGEIYFGMSAEVSTDTKELGKYVGKIGFISPIAEFTPKTVETTTLRTDLVYRLRIYVDNPGRYLKQGMPVTVKISSSPLRRPSFESSH